MQKKNNNKRVFGVFGLMATRWRKRFTESVRAICKMTTSCPYRCGRREQKTSD